MKLSLCTDVLGDLSFTEMLDKVKSLGIDAVEMTAGGWGGCKHVPTQELLADENKLKSYKAEIEKRGMEIAALNCSGNPRVRWENFTLRRFTIQQCWQENWV